MNPIHLNDLRIPQSDLTHVQPQVLPKTSYSSHTSVLIRWLGVECTTLLQVLMEFAERNYHWGSCRKILSSGAVFKYVCMAVDRVSAGKSQEQTCVSRESFQIITNELCNFLWRPRRYSYRSKF